MLAIVRVFIILAYAVILSLFALVFCLLRAKNPNNSRFCAHRLAALTPILGLKKHTIISEQAKQVGPCIYIANHQSNYDLLSFAHVVQPRTVAVGKKSLLWVPFFGLMYWASGNVLLDRSNRNKAHGTIAQIAEHIKQRNISVWMFPEGTRSLGRGLQPFKMGAFHAAIAAGVPVVPICLSEMHGQIQLNRWNNGELYIEMLDPIDTSGYNAEQVHDLADHCHRLMQEKINAFEKLKV